MLRKLILCAVVFTGSVFSQQQQGFRCPQEDGAFEFPGNCTQYFQCDGGAPTLTDCPHQLIFNPQVGYCDWPFRAPNPSCSNTPENQMCRQNPYGGPPDEAFHVGNPTMCNAFFTCINSYLYGPCSFCGEGMYFNTEAGLCLDYLSTGQDLNNLCQGREFVEHADKVFRQLDGSCWPFSNIPNPYQVLADALRNSPRPRQNQGFNPAQQGFAPQMGSNVQRGFAPQQQGFNQMQGQGK